MSNHPRDWSVAQKQATARKMSKSPLVELRRKQDIIRAQLGYPDAPANAVADLMVMQSVTSASVSFQAFGDFGGFI